MAISKRSMKKIAKKQSKKALKAQEVAPETSIDDFNTYYAKIRKTFDRKLKKLVEVDRRGVGINKRFNELSNFYLNEGITARFADGLSLKQRATYQSAFESLARHFVSEVEESGLSHETMARLKEVK